MTGAKRTGWTKRAFGNAVWSIEASNPGYHWDWDETKLKGKLVGVLFRNREWEMNGNTGWTTECCALTDVDDIRQGKYRQPKDKPLKVTSAAENSFAQINEDSGELPF